MIKIIKKMKKSNSVILTSTILLLSIIIFLSITLVATAQFDNVEESITNTVEEPDADFSADITSGSAPLTVTFTDESTGSPTELKWNFGDESPVIDGTTSDYKTTTHTYEKAGVYEVKETAINSVGRNTEIKPGYITVNNESSKNNDDSEPLLSEEPDADFSADITSGSAPLTVTFTDESTGSPTELEWNFGDESPVIDGTTSDYKTTTHTYEKAGVYEVKETAINSVGRNTEIKPGYITVNNKGNDDTNVYEPSNEETASSSQTLIINNTTHISNNVNNPTTNTSSNTNIDINRPTSSTNTNNPTSTDTRINSESKENNINNESKENNINSYNKDSNINSYNKDSNINNNSEETVNTSNSSINSKNGSDPNPGPSNMTSIVIAIITALGGILVAYIKIKKNK